MSSDKPDIGDKGLERGTYKCDSCGMPVSTLLNMKVVDNVSGNLVDEYWCKRCFFDKGETAQKEKERGR
jgi:hypothetical protein